MRAIASDGPPAANGMTIVIWRDGKFSATASPANASIAANTPRMIVFITLSIAPSHHAIEA
jgi:hypothetical protein